MVEQLLRAEGEDLLGPGFKSKVMSEIRSLPAPELLKPRRGWVDVLYSARLLSTPEKVTLALGCLLAVLVFIPGVSDLLTAWSWELSDMAVSITVGEEVLTASMVSVLTTTAGAAFLVGAGAYGAKQGMVGA